MENINSFPSAAPCQPSACVVHTHSFHRQQTNLQTQLEALAGQIGGLGLAAGALAMVGSSAIFTYSTFVIGQAPWAWAYLNDYLHFLILGITILVWRCWELGVCVLCVYLLCSVWCVLQAKNCKKKKII